MADYLPQATGNWSTTTWITAFSNLTAFAGDNTPPTIIDDVYADGKFITIDINTAVNSIRTTTTPHTGGLAGGGYFISDTITLTARSIIPGTTTCLTFLSTDPSTCTVVGNISGASTTGIHGVLNNSSGTINIFGNAIGSSIRNDNGRAILNNSSGTINIVGNITGGAGQNSEGLRNASTGVINLTGNSIGGSGASSSEIISPAGIRNTSSGLINVLGNVIGGSGSSSSTYGISNTSSGSVTITGSVIGGSTSVGVHTGPSSLGNIIVYGNIFNTGAAGCFLINNLSDLTLFGNISAVNGTGITHSGAGKSIIYGNVYAGLITANIVGITNNSTVGTVEIYGDVFGGNGTVATGLTHSGAGTTFINGNVYGSRFSRSQGVNNSGAGNVTIYGNVSAGVADSAHGARLDSSGTINIAGNVIGGDSNRCVGAYNTSSGTIIISGDVIGGKVSGSTGNVYAAGAQLGLGSATTGSIIILGNAIASDFIAGAINNSTTSGIVYVKKAIGNSFGLGSTGTVTSQPGVINFSQNSLLYVEEVEFGSRGQTPIQGTVYIVPKPTNTLTGRLTALGGTVTFYNSLSVEGLLPPVSSVRQGTVYNVGNSVGTMAVPSASAVQFGIPVDNTVGTAALAPQSVWGYSRLSATEVDSMGDRLRNTATTQSVGYQIASFNL